MSEARSVEQIQQEYGQICARIGQKSFQVEILKAEIQDDYKLIVELGKEMQKVQKENSNEPASATVSSAA